MIDMPGLLQNHTNSAIKCFHQIPSEESQFTEWINQQNVRWAVFTLKSPRVTSRHTWERLLNVCFTELERKYVKSTVKRHRKESCIPMLHRAVWLGGDSSASIAFHSQGLVELHDAGIAKLIEEMNKAWQHTVKYYFEEKHPVHVREDVWMSEAKVWAEEFEPSNGYAHYLNRQEGFDLGFGVQKVVLSASSLKPYATCILKP